MKTLNKLLQSIVMIVRVAPGCRLLLAALLASGLVAGRVRASDPITLTIETTNFSGSEIPFNFSGLSVTENEALLFPYDPFRSWTVLPGEFFAATNTELLTLFEQTGMHHVRLNWGIAAGTNLAALLTLPEVDSAFQFFQQVNIKVIFGIQQVVYTNQGLAVTNWQSLTNYDMGLAQHVMTNYAANLDNFAIGNEPEQRDYFPPPYGTGTWESDLITNYASYQSNWDGIAEAITNDCPDATFSGLDAGGYDFPSGASKGSAFSNFLFDAGNHVPLDYYTVHQYPSVETTDPNIGVGELLCSNLLIGLSALGDYQVAQSNAMGAVTYNYSFRFDEGEDMIHGCTNASDALAGALWLLDEIHWWATNYYCLGFDYQQVIAFPESVVYYNGQPSGHYEVFPKGEALKAWDLGGQGYYMVPKNFSNPNKVDATYYAVGDGQDLYLTFINKTNSTDVTFTTTNQGFLSASVAAMYMLSASGNLEATNDTTLGGVAITNNAQWQGMWTPGTPATNNGWCAVSVPPSEAAVVHLRAGCAYDGPICDSVGGSLFMNTIGPNNDVCISVQNTWASAAANWVLFADQGALANGVTATGAVVVIKDHYGLPEEYVAGSDGNVYWTGSTVTFSTGQTNLWIQLPGSQGVSNLVAQLNPDGSDILFGMTNGNVVFTSQTAPGGTPSGVWNNLGTPSGTTIQGFTVAQNLDGHLEVFGVDAGGNLWHIFQNVSHDWNTWSGWGEIDAGGATVDPHIQVVRNVYGYLYVFGLDASSGGIDYIYQTPGPHWSTWDTTDVGIPSGVTSLEPGFVVAQNGDGRFQVAAVGSDHNLWQRYVSSTTSFSWGPWYNYFGAHTTGLANMDTHLVVGNTEDEREQIFTIGSNGDVWSIWQTSPGVAWSSWTDFGGNGQKFY